jgi:glycine C-acetyltransferase
MIYHNFEPNICNIVYRNFQRVHSKKLTYRLTLFTDLEEKLKTVDARIKLIVTDGVFSMDGNVAPLDKIVELAKKYNALTFIDECHATGFFGKTGRGTEEFFNVMGRVDIINSTLGKALGGAAGGYTTGPKELIDLLRQKSRPYLFSNSLPPPVVGGAMKVKTKNAVPTRRKSFKSFNISYRSLKC